MKTLMLTAFCLLASISSASASVVEIKIINLENCKFLEDDRIKFSFFSKKRTDGSIELVQIWSLRFSKELGVGQSETSYLKVPGKFSDLVIDYGGGILNSWVPGVRVLSFDKEIDVSQVRLEFSCKGGEYFLNSKVYDENKEVIPLIAYNNYQSSFEKDLLSSHIKFFNTLD